MNPITAYIPIAVLLAICLGACFVSETGAPVEHATVSQSIPRQSDASSESVPAQCVLCYFHRTLRCAKWLSMEPYTMALFETDFKDGDSGTQLEFRVINFDQPQYEYYEEDFNLVFST